MTMNDVYRVMLDVSALFARGSDLARQVAAEHERQAVERAQHLAEEAALRPIGSAARIAPSLGLLRVRRTRGRPLDARVR